MEFVIFIILIILPSLKCYVSITNSKCYADSDCGIYTHGYCNSFNSHCNCNLGYLHIFINQTAFGCHKIATELNGSCSYHIQCQYSFGLDAICSDNKCICRKGSIFEETNSYCYFENAVRYSCSTSLDCKEGQCDGGFCKCKPDQILRARNKKPSCYQVSNTNCEFDEQCQYGVMGSNSYCKNNTTCFCSTNYGLQNDVCVEYSTGGTIHTKMSIQTVSIIQLLFYLLLLI